jgi:hypothetical protein
LIDPHWKLVDLDPRTWRNLGRFFDPGQYIRAAQPGEHGLFVLHDDGRVMRVVDTRRGVRTDLGLTQVNDPHALAHTLFERREWQRVHIINKRHLAHVAQQAQAEPRRELSLDAYYRLVYKLLWDESDGYVSAPPHPGHWYGWTYAGLKQFADQLLEEATLALGVFEEGTVAIGLILELSRGTIKRVTTFEALPLNPGEAQLSETFLEQLWTLLAGPFASPAGVLLCSQTSFEQWLAAEDKTASLNAARQQGTAFWRLALREDVLPAFQSLVTLPITR